MIKWRHLAEELPLLGGREVVGDPNLHLELLPRLIQLSNRP
jgi:hypothetical protein